jgi:deoxyribodipyrimidine photo-lyase
MTSVFWFRRDARLDDNPGLNAALSEGTVVPLFILDPRLLDRGSRLRRDLLMAGLADLDVDLQRHGGRLRVESGDPDRVIPAILEETGARRVHVSGEVTPYGRRRDSRVSDLLELVEHDGVYAVPPGLLRTASGNPYRVFSPFYRAWSAQGSTPVGLPAAASFTSSSGRGLGAFD